MQSLLCLQLAPSPPPLIGGGNRPDSNNSCFSGGTYTPIRFTSFPDRSSSLVCQAAKSKNVRDTVTIECTNCVRKDVEKRSNGVSRYTTQKNKRNTPGKLELKKYCRHCNKHTVHAEIKK